MPLLLLFLSIVLSSCAPGGVADDSSPPEVTPLVTPGESTPAESTPGESTPTESTPVESTPPESTPVKSTPENIDPNGIYVYKTLPDAFTELSAEMRAEIEEKAGVSIDWNKHYLGTHKGYIIFGTYDRSNAKLFRSYDRYFGKLNALYGYKDGVISKFADLADVEIDMETLVYIAYIGLKKEVGSVPVAGDDLSEETIMAIKSTKKGKNFTKSYFGMCGGYVVFGSGGSILDGYRGGIRKIQNHVILDHDDVWAYSSKTGIVDFYTLCNENLDIEYDDIIDTILIAALDGMKYWMRAEHMIG